MPPVCVALLHAASTTRLLVHRRAVLCAPNPLILTQSWVRWVCVVRLAQARKGILLKQWNMYEKKLKSAMSQLPFDKRDDMDLCVLESVSQIPLSSRAV